MFAIYHIIKSSIIILYYIKYIIVNVLANTFAILYESKKLHGNIEKKINKYYR